MGGWGELLCDTGRVRKGHGQGEKHNRLLGNKFFTHLNIDTYDSTYYRILITRQPEKELTTDNDVTQRRDSRRLAKSLMR